MMYNKCYILITIKAFDLERYVNCKYWAIILWYAISPDDGSGRRGGIEGGRREGKQGGGGGRQGVQGVQVVRGD